MLVRPARTSDVRVIRGLIDRYAPDRRLLSKATVTLYEDVTDFFVAEHDGQVVGCGALHVMWEDLAEVRTLAVSPTMLRQGIGSSILDALIQRGRDLGISRIFCLTFETGFFGAFGFRPFNERGVEGSVYEELLRSPDEGVAEFLDLERVRPNTLGNVRMVLSV
ncbi:MAG TPA: amino-acid N-acetyltransferase [Actinomycetota bacterium]|nr:amino-acid N-acetyltransferase [Actinomycetota bacterium]